METTQFSLKREITVKWRVQILSFQMFVHKFKVLIACHRANSKAIGHPVTETQLNTHAVYMYMSVKLLFQF